MNNDKKKEIKEDIKSLSITESENILSAIKRMDDIHKKLLVVIDRNGDYKSMLSIGDIQRAIIAGKTMDEPIQNILRERVSVASVHDSIEKIKSFIQANRIDYMPVIDDNNKIVKIIFWKDLFENDIKIKKNTLNIPVIIMAGGKGERLCPLTNVLPKPLIPIGKQTILEDIMDRFVDYGCHDFFISVNYKADLIRQYLENISKSQYNISFFQENKPLGTAGSLHLLKDKINSTFFVSNCDIIIDAEYDDILKYHEENKNEITVVAAIKNYHIPYGTLESGENGLLISIHEKPDLTFMINTGMYIMEPKLIEEIPKDEFFHITTLIEKLLNGKRKVGVYPINDGSWTDIGNWDEYLKLIR